MATIHECAKCHRDFDLDHGPICGYCGRDLREEADDFYYRVRKMLETGQDESGTTDFGDVGDDLREAIGHIGALLMLARKD